MPFEPRLFGNTGLRVGPIGVGSGYGLSAAGVEHAFAEGVRFFQWGGRGDGFRDGLRTLARKNRAETVISVQSYQRIAGLMGWSIDRALAKLGTDYIDVLNLAWWNGPVPERIFDAARTLKEKGKIRHLMVSSHVRPIFERYIDGTDVDAFMIRYNAAHPGAEREIFPHFTRRRPATVAFTSTRWGTLLDPRLVPEGLATPRASDCYRFALSNDAVDVCLTGPRDVGELHEALEAVRRGPLDADEVTWMRAVGASVRAKTSRGRRRSAMDVIDAIVNYRICAPKQLAAG